MNATPNKETGSLSIEQLTYTTDGLIPAIIQDSTDNQVLMLAWMDREALRRTLDSGEVWFYSRSRDRYWKKGEESGNVLHAHQVAYDCDGDVLLISCDIAGAGVACHTGERSCFYRTLSLQGLGEAESKDRS